MTTQSPSQQELGNRSTARPMLGLSALSGPPQYGSEEYLRGPGIAMGDAEKRPVRSANGYSGLSIDDLEAAQALEGLRSGLYTSFACDKNR